MSPCQSCGKTKQVTIKAKNFCANCGEPVKHAPKVVAQTIKPNAHNKASAHLLDLRKTQPTRAERPAQSIHGVRPTATRKATSTKPTPKLKQAYVAERVKRSQNSFKHPKISKFGTHTKTTDTKPAKEMSAHYSYGVKQQALPTVIEEIKHPLGQIDKNFLKQLTAAATKPKRINNIWQLIGAQRRLATVATVTAIAFVLAGYVTYLNVPGVSMRIAAARTGIDGQLPRYQPPGFAIASPVSTDNGKLVIQLVSKSDNQLVVINEQPTSWDPPTLLENYVLKRAERYEQLNQNGLTIYVYNGNHMAWINNGIMYTIEGNSHLLWDHIAKIATSL